MKINYKCATVKQTHSRMFAEHSFFLSEDNMKRNYGFNHPQAETDIFCAQTNGTAQFFHFEFHVK